MMLQLWSKHSKSLCRIVASSFLTIKIVDFTQQSGVQRRRHRSPGAATAPSAEAAVLASLGEGARAGAQVPVPGGWIRFLLVPIQAELLGIDGVGRVGLKTVNPAALQPRVANIPKDETREVTGVIMTVSRHKGTGPIWMEPVLAGANPGRAAWH